MGKKAKKTKWRTLEIPAPGKFTENGGSKWDEERRTPSANNHYQPFERTNIRRKPSPSPSPTTKASNLCSNKEESKGIVEDEYTKITTPRQDVLFKKGYLTRRKVPETISENSADQNNDGIAQDCSNNEDFSNYANGEESIQFMCPGPQSYIDPSALYYGGGYEIYDPYTGNVTVIVGPGAGQYPANSSCQPILTSVPCRPVPLQPVQWFNPVPSSDWCPYTSPSDKRYSTDSQNGSGVGSESSGIPESPPEMMEETMNGNSGPVFPPSYVYPGFMFGAPIYNVDDVNTQYYVPESPTLSTNELTTSKRRRKKKRRRRTETEEESESSFDDNCSRSISSSEFILDSHLSSESQHDFEELYVRSESSSAAVPFPSFPHPNVNAPEFVPTTELSLLKSKKVASHNQNVTDLSDDNTRSSDSVNSCHDELVSEKFTKKASPLNVYCGKTYEDAENKHDSESVSCSNNSDSGISSPGSEDISKNGFGEKEGKSQNEEAKKKPRSKKSGSKAKNNNKSSEETKKSNQTTKTIAISMPKEANKERKVGGEEKKAELKKTVVRSVTVSKKAIRKEKKNETVIAIASKTNKKADKKKNAKKSVVQCEKTLDAIQLVRECEKDDDEEDSLIVAMHSCTENLSEERAENVDESEWKHIKGEACSIENVDEEEKMLNEYVKINEKPILAKLRDVNEIKEEKQDVIEEISSISEFSCCRENSQPNRSRKKLHREDVELAAKQVVNEIIDRAEERVLSSMSCDKLQLPITEAVTKWLNEHGGLSVAENAYDSQSDCEESVENSVKTVNVEKKSKRLKQNCVIC